MTVLRYLSVSLLLWLTLLLPIRLYAAAVGLHTFASSSKLASGTWVKVALSSTQDGIYQISYDQLSRMGFSQPQQVGVYGFGGTALPEANYSVDFDDLPEVAVRHDAEQRRILFYGKGLTAWTYNSTRGFIHRTNTYDTQSYYFLHQKDTDEAPLAMDTLSANPRQWYTSVTQYDEHYLHEENQINIGQTGREKYGESFLSETTQRFAFDTLDASSSVRVQVSFVACATEASTYSVTLNGTSVGTATCSALPDSYTYATEGFFNDTLTLNKSTALQVAVTYTPPSGVTPTVARLNYIRVSGKRSFRVPATYSFFRSLEARSLSTVRLVLGSVSTTANIEVWDVTSPTDVMLQSVAESDGGFVPKAKGLREYALVNVKAKDFPTVNVIGTVANQNLHALPMTDMLILTAPAYKEQAETLAAFRRANDGLHVTVATPEEIYNEFSSGHQDVTAIRMFIKMFFDRYYNSDTSGLDATVQGDATARRIRYLLLWGDGYYDNTAIDRNYYLPCYETDESLQESTSCVCDDYFGFLDDGEGGDMSSYKYVISQPIVDIGIGRFPVSTVEQSKNVLAKTLSYSRNTEYGVWKNRICFLSDDEKEGDAANAHIKHNDALVDILDSSSHYEFIPQKIYLPAYKQTTSASGTDYPDAKKEFQESLKQGVLMVNYAGHGNTTTITNENLMDVQTAASLNMSHLPLWITASCDVSRWDEDGTSLGETLLFNANGGAIALISTVRIVMSNKNLLLNSAIFQSLFLRNSDGTRYRVGDIIQAAKRSFGSSDTNKLKFCLLGDPSLTLTYPEQQVKITAINGEAPTSGSQFNLPVLSTVTVKGKVLKTGSSSAVDTTFHGLIYPTFYDATDTLVADKGYLQSSTDPYSFTTRTKKAFAGRAEVKSGEFEFSFTIPTDISYKGSAGLANFYACSTSGKEAAGYFSDYCLTGTNNYNVTDTEGPAIDQLFLNNLTWQDGDVVGPTPYFYAEVTDKGGFNATGNVVGHDITLTLRSTSNLLLATEQYILNDYFTTFTDDPTRGNVQYSIPELEEGTYEATFRIWDIYNNPTTRQFTFTVSAQQAPSVAVAQAYPCPARTGDTITFRVLHTFPESAENVTLEVYNQMGYKVHEATLSQNASTKVYLEESDDPTSLTSALGADESAAFLGSATLEWDSSVLRAGFYLYRLVLTSGESTACTSAGLLIVNP